MLMLILMDLITFFRVTYIRDACKPCSKKPGMRHPTIFNKTCTYVTFNSAISMIRQLQLRYNYPLKQTVHLPHISEATNQYSHEIIQHMNTFI